jgi:adenosyl cobinamide kinase/adenosyl cobinamide phosphate guanylyltransferase
VFRDLAGLANQFIAREADEVYVMWAGIPQKIKGGGNKDARNKC